MSCYCTNNQAYFVVQKFISNFAGEWIHIITSKTRKIPHVIHCVGEMIERYSITRTIENQLLRYSRNLVRSTRRSVYQQIRRFRVMRCTDGGKPIEIAVNDTLQ